LYPPPRGGTFCKEHELKKGSPENRAYPSPQRKFPGTKCPDFETPEKLLTTSALFLAALAFSQMSAG